MAFFRYCVLDRQFFWRAPAVYLGDLLVATILNSMMNVLLSGQLSAGLNRLSRYTNAIGDITAAQLMMIFRQHRCPESP